MRKYLAFLKTSLLNAFVYRGPMVVWLAANSLSLVTAVAIWFSASAGERIGGYTKPELITYYVAALSLQWLTGWFPFYSVCDEIKHGEIVSRLVKPISYFWQKFAEELGWHLVSSLLGLATTFLFAFFLRDFIVLNFSLTRILLLVPTIILAILVVFSFSLCMGLLSFWFLEVGTVDNLFWIARLILGGQGIPISFIPEAFQIVVKILPFRYMFSFPLEIYFGRLSAMEIIQGVSLQFFWVAILAQLYKLMWNRGRRAYTAFGQ
ncbi:MAG TPA: ABC-2 family transporter protein [Candidatus Bathyarchaeia archaeon]|nr:ABC-2 family transporter protein [Candidatus Bathyarchaeia archaeon]